MWHSVSLCMLDQQLLSIFEIRWNLLPLIFDIFFWLEIVEFCNTGYSQFWGGKMWDMHGHYNWPGGTWLLPTLVYMFNFFVVLSNFFSFSFSTLEVLSLLVVYFYQPMLLLRSNACKVMRRVHHENFRFCFGCIDNWATITNLCPLCQNEFQLITCVPVSD